jgi:UDP-N-acetylmuramyl pentapeptide phosphotransferase/UDP-N-acetylglucosamine-1-phosphate transferase
MHAKSPVKALLLSFIPGAGFLYLNRKGKAFLYGMGFFGPLLLLLIFGAAGELSNADELIVILLLVSFGSAVINLIDMVLKLIRRPSGVPEPYDYIRASEPLPDEIPNSGSERERMVNVLLSFIPGLGHLQLGLMQRGVTLMMAFFGSAVMIIFVAILTHQGGFLIFLGVLPILWSYGLFDTIQQLNRKQRGEPLVDQTIFEDLQEHRAGGKKNKMIATFLSIIPGAGHMYLGLQKRGLQLMAAFLFCVYIMDVLRLSFFLFLIPLLWFYSFFDALQQISRQDREEELKDTPFVDWLINHQKWVGIALLALGLYYLTDEVILRTLDRLFPKEQISSLFHQYFQTFVVSVILIGGGLRLMLGSQRKKGGSQ